VPFLTITGLMTRELHISTCASVIIHISIESLCSGGDQDLRHNDVGYVAINQVELRNCTVGQKGLRYPTN